MENCAPWTRSSLHATPTKHPVWQWPSSAWRASFTRNAFAGNTSSSASVRGETASRHSANANPNAKVSRNYKPWSHTLKLKKSWRICEFLNLSLDRIDGRYSFLHWLHRNSKPRLFVADHVSQNISQLSEFVPTAKNIFRLFVLMRYLRACSKSQPHFRDCTLWRNEVAFSFPENSDRYDTINALLSSIRSIHAQSK